MKRRFDFKIDEAVFAVLGSIASVLATLFLLLALLR